MDTQRPPADRRGSGSKAEALGAGEIVVNSIDNDGKMKGYDLALARKVRGALRLPRPCSAEPDRSQTSRS